MSDSLSNVTFTRRQMLAAAGSAVVLGFSARAALADVAATEKAISEVVGDKTLNKGRVDLTLPEIAENGSMVPLEVEVESPMTESDHVKAVHVFAEGNPSPEVAIFHFTPANGRAWASTRIRLAKTQDIVAVAEMSDGSMYTARQEVRVTIGGCGG
ncbi:MAG: thiosulfate oxidation carrier protein SoxY [Halofilum sp. (in: g-proteobacteria)]|nr:thiosulfate oxidation carrier protein SoxY [Halofilum sp. (in: g-proteobacteria)]